MRSTHAIVLILLAGAFAVGLGLRIKRRMPETGQALITVGVLAMMAAVTVAIGFSLRE